MFDTIAGIAARRHGRITSQLLRAAGVDGDRIKRWTADGRLRRVHRGDYAVGRIPVTTIPRILLDLSPHLTPPELTRAPALPSACSKTALPSSA